MAEPVIPDECTPLIKLEPATLQFGWRLQASSLTWNTTPPTSGGSCGNWGYPGTDGTYWCNVHKAQAVQL